MINRELTATHSSMLPLPAPLWVEGQDDHGSHIQGVAVGLSREHYAPIDPETFGSPDVAEPTIFAWVVLADDGRVCELHTDYTSVCRAYTGNPYQPYLDALREEGRA